MKLLETDGRRLHAVLLRLTLRHDVAEDLMQDLVIKLAGSDGFAKAERPYAYARRAATNLVLDWRRYRGRRRAVSESSGGLDEGGGAGDLLAGLSGAEEPADLVMQRAEEIDRMLDEVVELPERSQRVLTMRFVDRVSYDEVAKELGTTASRARGLCFAAIRQLRKRLGVVSRGHRGNRGNRGNRGREHAEGTASDG